MPHPRWRRTLLALTLALAASPVVAGTPDNWSKPTEPFRIAGNIYYVGTEGLASYLITSPQGAVLLDAPLAENAETIERNIQRLGVRLSDVKVLISSHAHADHVGALAQLKRATGARYLASLGDRSALENGQNEGDNNYGVQPFAPITVDQIVRDGEVIRLGDIALTAHLTPGHSRGCTSWSTTVNDRGVPREVMFLCSLTVAGNTLVGNKAYPGIAEDFRTTFNKLATMTADIVLTGHPEAAEVLERDARRLDGEDDAFVDPQLLQTLVAGAEKDFEQSLAEAQGKASK